MKDKLAILKTKLARELEEATQGAKYARSSSEHEYYQTREEVLDWCLKEVSAIIQEDDIN